MPNIFDLKIDLLGGLDAKKRLEMLQLPARKRRQLLSGWGRGIKRASVKNLRERHDVDGKPWAPRKRGTDRKLLRKLNRQVAANVITDDYVDISFRGAVAFQQHEGVTKAMTAAAMQREQKGREHYNEPATKKQAKRLRELNYKIRIKGTKKWRAPPLKWIQENLTQKRAGLIIAHLEDRTPKKQWVTTVPGRPFLGATRSQVTQFVNSVYDNTINARV